MITHRRPLALQDMQRSIKIEINHQYESNPESTEKRNRHMSYVLLLNLFMNM